MSPRLISLLHTTWDNSSRVSGATRVINRIEGLVRKNLCWCFSWILIYQRDCSYQPVGETEMGSKNKWEYEA